MSGFIKTTTNNVTTPLLYSANEWTQPQIYDSNIVVGGNVTSTSLNITSSLSIPNNSIPTTAILGIGNYVTLSSLIFYNAPLDPILQVNATISSNLYYYYTSAQMNAILSTYSTTALMNANQSLTYYPLTLNTPLLANPNIFTNTNYFNNGISISDYFVVPSNSIQLSSIYGINNYSTTVQTNNTISSNLASYYTASQMNSNLTLYPTLAGTNTLSNAGTAIAVTNNMTIGGTLGVTGALTSGAHTASTLTSTGLLTASNGFTVTTGTITLPASSIANASLASAVPTLAGANTFSNAGTAIAVTNNMTVGGTLGVTGALTSGAHTASTLTSTGILTCSSALVTQGLVYETTTTVGGTANTYTLSYSSNGVFYIPVSIAITANSTLVITNIPTTTTQSFTFTVGYYQASTRFYINSIRVSDTTGTTYLVGSSSTFATPWYNGGTPALTGTSNCLILQQFTVFSVGTTRYVGTSISCFQ